MNMWLNESETKIKQKGKI